MGVRNLARQRALQLLYALDYAAAESTFEDVERLFLMADASRRRGWGPFPHKLAEIAFRERTELDQAIHPYLRNWTLDRLPRVDRLCLRMALCELRHFSDIPLRVTINEYIELTRLFSTDESPQYINAVLDRLAKEFPHKDFQAGEEESEKEADAEDAEDADELAEEGPPEPPAQAAPPPALKPEGATPRPKLAPRQLFRKGPQK